MSMPESLPDATQEQQPNRPSLHIVRSAANVAVAAEHDYFNSLSGMFEEIEQIDPSDPEKTIITHKGQIPFAD